MADHPCTGYELLDEDEEAEAVLAALGAERRTCANCHWLKGGHWGAPFPDGEKSVWMDPRCEYRYIDLLDQEYRRDPHIENFGAGYKRDHQCPGGCGQKAVVFVSRWVRRWGRIVGDLQPADDRRCQEWWSRNYPRVWSPGGGINGKPDWPPCVHWRDRLMPGDTTTIWEELDARPR